LIYKNIDDRLRKKARKIKNFNQTPEMSTKVKIDLRKRNEKQQNTTHQMVLVGDK